MCNGDKPEGTGGGDAVESMNGGGESEQEKGPHACRDRRTYKDRNRQAWKVFLAGSGGSPRSVKPRSRGGRIADSGDGWALRHTTDGWVGG